MDVVTNPQVQIHTPRSSLQRTSKLSARHSTWKNHSLLAGKFPPDLFTSTHLLTLKQELRRYDWRGHLRKLRTRVLIGRNPTKLGPLWRSFPQVGKGDIVPVLQTLGSPTTTSADYAKAASDFVDSFVAPGLAIPVETKWLWMGAVLAQVCIQLFYYFNPPIEKRKVHKNKSTHTRERERERKLIYSAETRRAFSPSFQNPGPRCFDNFETSALGHSG